MDIWNELECELERYRSSHSLIQQYLDVYEKECEILIEQISECSSFEAAQGYFESLHAVQRRLSTAKYKFSYPLGSKLESFVYHLDRDDFYSRCYWYDKFRGDIRWPND